MGGSIGLGGYYTAQSNSLDFVTISGRKENGTAGNTAGYLQFATRPNGGNMTEAVRITSTGNVGIGDTTPDLKLDVLGYGKFGDADNDPAPYDNGLSIANAANTPTSLFLWQSGQSSGHLGFRSGDTNLYLVNSYSDGLITNTAAVTLDTASRKSASGLTTPGTSGLNEKFTTYGNGIVNNDSNTVYSMFGSFWRWESARRRLFKSCAVPPYQQRRPAYGRHERQRRYRHDESGITFSITGGDRKLLWVRRTCRLRREADS